MIIAETVYLFYANDQIFFKSECVDISIQIPFAVIIEADSEIIYLFTSTSHVILLANGFPKLMY